MGKKTHDRLQTAQIFTIYSTFIAIIYTENDNIKILLFIYFFAVLGIDQGLVTC
jgi:hypothetical protein